MATMTAQKVSAKPPGTSRQLGWSGLVLEMILHPGGEFQNAPAPNHLVCLNLGGLLCLERGEDGSRIQQQQMPGGFATVIAAGQPSLWRHAATAHHLHLHLSPALLDRTAELMTPGRTGTLAGISAMPFYDPHVEQIAGLLRQEMEAGGPSGNLYAETLASALSVRLLQREHDLAHLPVLPSSPTKLRLELQRATAYIQDNLASDLSLNAIAREAGLSSYHFARLFAEAFGVAPHQYVIQARVERARVLITRDGLPPGEAAQRVGFADQSHLTRHFKRLVGVTPRAFARDTSRRTTF